MKKILFVVHESKNTGAPLLLLNLLKEIHQKNPFAIEVLIKKSGELDKDFAFVGPTHFFYPHYLIRLNIVSKILRRILPKKESLKIYQYYLLKKLRKKQFDVIYFNSLGSNEMFTFLENYSCKKVVHVHELNSVVEQMDASNVQNMMRNASLYISSYQVVSHFIKTHFNIPSHKILENSPYLFPQRKEAIDNKKVLSTQKKVFRIGGCGAVEERKGTDIFIEFALQLINKNPRREFEFLWIGNDQTKLAENLKNKVLAAALQEKIKFVGTSIEPESYFLQLDAFFLSSREEAFGLVGLENAYCQNPLISFDIKGDLPLFIKKYNCGKVIAQFDFNAFNDFIIELLENPAQRKELGWNGRNAVITDFKIENEAQVIVNVLRSLT